MLMLPVEVRLAASRRQGMLREIFFLQSQRGLESCPTLQETGEDMMGAIAPGKSNVSRTAGVRHSKRGRAGRWFHVRISRGLEGHAPTKMAAWERMMTNTVWDDRQLSSQRPETRPGDGLIASCRNPPDEVGMWGGAERLMRGASMPLCNALVGAELLHNSLLCDPSRRFFTLCPRCGSLRMRK